MPKGENKPDTTIKTGDFIVPCDNRDHNWQRVEGLDGSHGFFECRDCGANTLGY